MARILEKTLPGRHSKKGAEEIGHLSETLLARFLSRNSLICPPQSLTEEKGSQMKARL